MALAPILQFPGVHNVQSPSETTDRREKDYLTAPEMDRLLTAAKQGRYGVRDHAMLFLAYRHGLRVSELVGLRMHHLNLETAKLWVPRLKGSLSTEQPIEGDALRAVRHWLRARASMRGKDLPWLFLSERGAMSRKAVNYLMAEAGKRAGLPCHVHPHMLRHSCGYYLANKGYDTRLIQDYLGHKNIQHTVRYTRTASTRFEGLWRRV
jgi:type 1 fimbriae regulatory protein FimB